MKGQDLKKNKPDLLIKSPQNLFHTQDLALLWGIDNKNTLYTTIKRYVKKGTLIRIQKGFYSKVPLNQLNPVRLGISFLHCYSYLSTESILAEEGVISQSIPHITLISSKSKRFEVAGNSYISRQMKDEFLFNEAGIKRKSDIKRAGLERAVADIQYYNEEYHFDASDLINWGKVEKIKETVGY